MITNQYKRQSYRYI